MCCGLWVSVFVVGGECMQKCQWLADCFSASSKLSACLGDALGVRGVPMPFLSVSICCTEPQIRGVRCSVSHLSIAVLVFCWFSFYL